MAGKRSNSVGTIWQVSDQLQFPATVLRQKRDSDTSNIQGASYSPFQI